MSDATIQRYLNPRFGLWGLTKSKLKMGTTKNLRNIYSIQRHREVTHPMRQKQMRYIKAQYPFHCVQVDLAFLPQLRSPVNNNIWGFIVVIDVFTRYLWVKTFTNRKALHIALEDIILNMMREFGKIGENWTGDLEFATTENHRLAAKYNFEWHFSDAHEIYRKAIGERVIRTIKNLIKRYVTQYNTTKYIDVLSDLIYNYNHTIHRTIQTTPYKAITSGNIFDNREANYIPPLDHDTKVRVLLHRNVFTKGDSPYYSRDVYKISGRDKNRYILKSPLTSKPIQKRYARHQLLPIKSSFEGGNQQNKENSDDSVGYDEGIKENIRRNRHNKALNREGIDLNKITDPEERDEAMIQAGQPLPPIEEAEEFGRIDDVDSKWDKLKISEYSKMPTNGDGACLFNAIAGFLKYEKDGTILRVGSKQEATDSQIIRKNIVRYIENNLNKKIPGLEQSLNDNIKEQLEQERDNRSIHLYLNDMKQRWCWGGQAEIIGFCMRYKRNILVYVERRNNYIKHGGFIFDENDDKIITLFWNKRNYAAEGNHYEYLIPKHETPSPSPSAPPSPSPSSSPSPSPEPLRRSPRKRKIRLDKETSKVKILPKNVRDKDGWLAKDWDDPIYVGQWMAKDKKQTKWMLLVVHNGKHRYEGYYDRGEHDIYEEGPVPEAPSSSPSPSPEPPKRHRKRRKRRKK